MSIGSIVRQSIDYHTISTVSSASQSIGCVHILQRFHALVNRIHGLDVHAFSLIVPEHVPQPIPFLESLDVHDDGRVVIRRFSAEYGPCNQVSHRAVRDRPVLPSQSMMIGNQPGSARPFGFCQGTPWHGTREDVVRDEGPLFESGKLLHYVLFSNEETLEIHERRHGHVEKRELPPMPMFRRFYIRVCGKERGD